MRTTGSYRALVVALGLVVAAQAAVVGAAAAEEARHSTVGPNPGVAWPAVDALGRVVPTADEVGAPKADRFVGIFYFLWLNERDNKSPNHEGPWDVSKILAKDPDALSKPAMWGPVGRSHYWSEPLYGYYLSTDPWVLRRHAYLLADAGIDTLIFDTTNAITYRDVYMKLCEVFEQVRREGGRTPHIAFMVNTEAGKTAQRIYDELYKPGLHKDLWFIWQGKPLLICDPAVASPELKEFFTLRKAHWPFEQINTPYAWHWEAAYPQVYGYTDDPNKPEQVNVAVAQNLRAADGKVTNMSDGNARGRSFHDGKMDAAPDAVNHGHNAQEQWKRAISLDPPFVMVTGWNEWIAGRWGKPEGPVLFVDQFSQEYSRDIEPMKGGHNDNYYWQLVANVRRYKGAVPLPEASPAKAIRLRGDFKQWDAVAPEFRDHVGETIPRDFDGAGGLHYANRTGRNDIVACKVARDREKVYFHVRTREPLTGRSSSGWMWLLIDADNDPATGWLGCEYLVNRTARGDNVSIEKHAGGWNWRRVGTAPIRCEENQLHLAITRSVLQIAGDGGTVSLGFKWVDNPQQPGEPMALYLDGDCAPEGRFLFRYTAP